MKSIELLCKHLETILKSQNPCVSRSLSTKSIYIEFKSFNTCLKIRISDHGKKKTKSIRSIRNIDIVCRDDYFSIKFKDLHLIAKTYREIDNILKVYFVSLGLICNELKRIKSILIDIESI